MKLFLLSRIIDILYGSYIDINNFGFDINKFYEQSIISSNFHNEMKTFIGKRVNFNDYIYENNNANDYIYEDILVGLERFNASRRRRVRERRRRRERGREGERGREIIFNIPNERFVEENEFDKEKKIISLLFQYIFTYFDLCLILFFRDKKSDIFKYWINSENKFFKFKSDYKILSIDKNYSKNDYKVFFYCFIFRNVKQI